MSKYYVSLVCLLLMSLGTSMAKERNHQSAWGDQGNNSYRNPILAADFSDPDVIRVGDKYYMVASDFHFMGMQMLESEDMVNWRYVSQIYDRLDFPEYDSMSRYSGGSWAPTLRYHNGEFYVYFCTPHEGLFMSKSSSPAGPWSPLQLVKAIEKWEDPCPFWDEDGQAYLGHSLYGAGPIIIHKMSADGEKLLDEGVTVYEGPVAEGTKIHKINGLYYLSIPEGGVRGGWQTVLRSPSIYGPYEGRRVLEQGSTSINGPHQGALVDTPDGDWWFYHFQETDALGRIVHLQPVGWSDDGWPSIGVDLDGNGVGEPVEYWQMPVVTSSDAYALLTNDDFNQSALSLQWQWNQNPVDEAWTLCEPYGSLTLNALYADNLKSARNTLTQKSLGWHSQFTVAMNVADMADGQHSGLACMGKGNRMLGVKQEDGKRYLYVSNDTVDTEICEITDTRRPVYLRLNLDFPNKAYSYQYSFNNKDYFDADSVFYLRWGNWKGVRPALYTFNNKCDGGKAHFDWVRYVHDGPNFVSTQPDPFHRSEEDEIVQGIATTSFPDRMLRVSHIECSDNARQCIQNAIDSCSYLGGGTVDVAPGVYDINGNIVLKSNVNLHLQKGATLRFSGRADDFLPPLFTRWEGTELYGHSPMIYALHANNIAITGEGIIDGQAGVEMGQWGYHEADDRDRLREQGETLAPVNERVYGEGTILRPTCVEMIGCSRILIEDITVKNSPFWTIHPLYCDNVIVQGVSIDSHFPNNDGCDPESTSNVLIENCRFDVGDDAIAIKSGRDADGRRVGRPSENIVIRNCLFNSECNGLCIGSEMSGGVQNVYMHDIQIQTVKNAIYFKSNRDRGGYIRNVYVNDITVDHTLGAVLRFETNYFGFRGGQHASLYENFIIRNVDARLSDNYGLFISGYPEKPVRDVLIENVNIHKAQTPVYLHCTEDVILSNVTINGTLMPSSIPDDPQERTLDIY